MKHVNLKEIVTTAQPKTAANGNSWEPTNKVLDLRTVLREWQADFEETGTV